MGYGVASVQNILELWKLGYLSNCKRICEMGSQEIHIANFDFISLLSQAGVDLPNSFDPEKFNGRPTTNYSAKLLYELLGISDYTCIDANGEHGAIVHDYNLPFTNTNLFSQYDIVTDHGACEHCFNIAEAYATMHKLCKSGGLIIISQMLLGGNGYFLYDKCFFEGIAAANSYKILYDSYVVCLNKKTEDGSDMQYHIPLNKDLLSVIDLNKVKLAVYAVLLKEKDNEFQFPYQQNLEKNRKKHYGFNRIYHRDHPSYSYIPVYRQWIEEIPSKLHKELVQNNDIRILIHGIGSVTRRLLSKPELVNATIDFSTSVSDEIGSEFNGKRVFGINSINLTKYNYILITSLGFAKQAYYGVFEPIIPNDSNVNVFTVQFGKDKEIYWVKER